MPIDKKCSSNEQNHYWNPLATEMPPKNLLERSHCARLEFLVESLMQQDLPRDLRV